MPDETASPLLPSFGGAFDTQVDALLAVLEANFNAALSAHVPGGAAVREAAPWPITLQTIVADRLPALSVFAESASSVREGKRKLVGRTFRVVWWMEPCAYDRVSRSWPLLNMAWQVVLSTIDGRALYDLEAENGQQPARRIRPHDLLAHAGFRSVALSSLQGSFNFVQDTAAAQTYPLFQATFSAVHEDVRGPFVYDPDSLPPLAAFMAMITERDRKPEEQPAVQVIAESTEETT